MARSLVLLALALLGTTTAQLGYDLPVPAPGYSYDGPGLRTGAGTGEQDPLAALAANIPGGGVPGQNFPVLAAVPDSAFSCQDQEFPGYFADTAEEAACQVIHICQFDGRHDSFLCPNGTLFSQQYLVCDWWFNVDCAASEQFFARNAEIGRAPEDAMAAASFRSDAAAPGGGYRAPEQRQAAPAPSQQYGAPQERQAAPAPPPSQLYGVPQQRQAAPAPAPAPAPSPLYSFPSRL